MVMAAIDLDILVFNGRLVLIVYILCPDIINRLEHWLEIVVDRFVVM